MTVAKNGKEELCATIAKEVRAVAIGERTNSTPKKKKKTTQGQVGT